ncbi:hypothetical protein GRAN_1046 [Granulicella sibirica]|uniref:Zinc-finger domain-containing protein n=2 Tax=Granulicella sibirica TaxID=2479048 RepID=A0A4Q0T7R2_9BACT|nr:hypothetical protein GRAN_1046 [Granulicella sibirica]
MVLASYGELPDDQAIVLERHLQDCATCRQELAEVQGMFSTLETRPVVELNPNFLAQSRMRLDEALDQIPSHSFFARLRTNFFRWVGNVQSAPALATLLLGFGFLAGNYVHRYQDEHTPKPQPPIVLTNATEGAIANVSGIVRTANPDVVQVLYNRVVPESMEGSLNDPQIRELLLMGTRAAAANGVRTDSVSYLANECRSAHGCKGDSDGKDVRSALMVSLRYDKNSGVRMKALDGLEPYVEQDRHVRDAVLDALLHDTNPQVRTEAIGLLQPVQADSSVRQVLRTVSTSDDNPYIRTASFQALQGMDALQ